MEEDPEHYRTSHRIKGMIELVAEREEMRSIQLF
jgi:hypothetical protein